MAAIRRQESLWWFECQRARQLQQSQPREAGVKSPATGGRFKEEVILRPDDGDEEEIDFRKDRE
jgi:hypothetical protein